jgi:hypothetical protein
LVECCIDGRNFQKDNHLNRGTLELCQSDHRVLGHLPDQGPSLPIAHFGRPALGRFLVVPNFFYLRMMEATVFLGTFNAAEMFWYTFPRSVPRHNPISELYGQFLRPHGLVFALA